LLRADGGQLAQIAALVDSGALRPVIDRVFAFDALNEAMAYLATGRAKGKVVIAR
jgi:NADPH:quinone reductase-like Zn-dependent oxidoreductase